MKRYLERLLKEHRRLNRLIDTCRNASRQDEMKALKRLRKLVRTVVKTDAPRCEGQQGIAFTFYGNPYVDAIVATCIYPVVGEQSHHCFAARRVRATSVRDGVDGNLIRQQI